MLCIKKWNYMMLCINVTFIIFMIVVSMLKKGNDVAYIDILLSIVHLILPITTLFLLRKPNKKWLKLFIFSITTTSSLFILGVVWQGGLLALYYLGGEKYRSPLLFIFAIVGLIIVLVTMVLGFFSWNYVIKHYYKSVDDEVKAFKTIWNIISIGLTVGLAIYKLGFNKMEYLSEFQFVFIPLSANLMMHLLSLLNGEFKTIFGKSEL
ncbi:MULTISPECIES: hypothetical protein [Staphylococcus]|uniref:hypothetical protein n=1 Tax=Staphylococcus TaxID=1279 RepID=UPI000E3C29A9|nr:MULTISPECIES: hypothetical protein [Staphylococcus]GBY65907.1 hypothetical protein M6K074_2300 [Staphylococcus aureus]GBY65983.1 hypothetical protein M6K074_2376 [Staphylococcus aureus]HDM3609997.1 hypothetical protein [Staphylococcus aureus]HDM3615740.1 hypothetical protein [Staphylococcus aureus]HDM4013055.1 hypothetical protein [Staphylococcus aureus]